MKIKKAGIYFFTLLTIIFIVLVFITVSFSYALKIDEWYIVLFTSDFLYIPFILYELAVSAALAGFVTILVFSISRKKWKKIVSILESLAAGDYSFDEKTDKFYSEILNESIEKKNIKNSIILIRQRLIDLSADIQALSNQPQLVGPESKEEILEKERHRLARELHDSVSQQLFAAMMMLSALSQQLDGSESSTQDQLQKIERVINEAQSEMRALLFHLRPVKLEGKNLKEGLVQLLKELSTKVQLKIKWSIEDVTLPVGMENHLFRIVQELLSNVLRHSKAKEVEVYLVTISGSVSLRVIDDGIGFDTNNEKLGNYGLLNIRERVAGMGGSCKIISFETKGTSVEIKIPLVKGSK